MRARPLDRVVALGAEITELRRRLRACEAELGALLGAASPRATGQPAPRSTPRPKRTGGGTTARILALLEKHPRDVFDAAEVATHLAANVGSVRVMLKRLLDGGKIRRTGRGAYRAR